MSGFAAAFAESLGLSASQQESLRLCHRGGEASNPEQSCGKPEAFRTDSGKAAQPRS